MKEIIKTIVPRPIIAFGKNLTGAAMTKLKVRRLLKDPGEIKLELGAGTRGRTRAGWLTLDHDFGSDIYWDLTRGLPFPDGVLSVIYSSHVLEHFTHAQLIKLLAECHRVLRSGGEFSVCVPNARIYVEGYLDPQHFDTAYLDYTPALYSNKRMDIVNFIAYLNGEHRHMFDEENLVYMLEKSGFESVRIREFDPGIDMPERKLGSIYATGIKS